MTLLQDEGTSAPPLTSRARRTVLRPRRTLVKIHRWLSLVLLAWFAVVAITGAGLVFDDQLNAWFRPELYQQTEGDVGPSRAMRAVEHALPEGRVTYIAFPDQSRGVYQVYVDLHPPDAPESEHRHRTAYVDPGTGFVNGVRDEEAGFTWWLYRGHMFLWQDSGFLGLDGDDLVAWFAIAFLVVLVSGLYLWTWPGVKRWATALRVRRRRGRFTFNLDLHRATGIVVVVPLIIITFTGAAFAFPAMRNWYERLTPAAKGGEIWVPPDEAYVSADPPPGAAPLDADRALAAFEAEPGYTVEGITPPFDETGVWEAWVTRGFSPWTREGSAGNVYVLLDQYSGEVRYVGTPEEGSVAEQMWSDWSFPLHTGDFLGTPSRLAWLGVAVSPLVLGVTGLIMWLTRRRKRKRAAERRAEMVTV
jgi:uncharacterized iron-regulated membrane protein